MENNFIDEIRFAMQREILIQLLKSESITKKEYDKVLGRLQEKHNCKLIVTYPNL